VPWGFAYSTTPVHKIVKKRIRVHFTAQTVKPLPATFSSFLSALHSTDSKVRSDLAACSQSSPPSVPLGLYLNVFCGETVVIRSLCTFCNCRQIATNATFSIVFKAIALVFFGDTVTLQVVDLRSRFVLVTI
jgi:hypothetical protein